MNTDSHHTNSNPTQTNQENPYNFPFLIIKIHLCTHFISLLVDILLWILILTNNEDSSVKELMIISIIIQILCLIFLIIIFFLSKKASEYFHSLKILNILYINCSYVKLIFIFNINIIIFRKVILEEKNLILYLTICIFNIVLEVFNMVNFNYEFFRIKKIVSNIILINMQLQYVSNNYSRDATQNSDHRENNMEILGFKKEDTVVIVCARGFKKNLQKRIETNSALNNEENEKNEENEERIQEVNKENNKIKIKDVSKYANNSNKKIIIINVNKNNSNENDNYNKEIKNDENCKEKEIIRIEKKRDDKPTIKGYKSSLTSDTLRKMTSDISFDSNERVNKGKKDEKN